MKIKGILQSVPLQERFRNYYATEKAPTHLVEGSPSPGWFHEQAMREKERQEADGRPDWTVTWARSTPCPWCGRSEQHSHPGEELA